MLNCAVVAMRFSAAKRKNSGLPGRVCVKVVGEPLVGSLSRGLVTAR